MPTFEDLRTLLAINNGRLRYISSLASRLANVLAHQKPLGLLPLLKSIHRPTELKKFAGETLGVDAYGWLHRGAIACAVDLAKGNPTRK